MSFSLPNRLQGKLGATLLTMLIAGYAGQAGAQQAGAQAGAPTGTYTTQQASAGAVEYQTNCAACHGAQLQGTTAAPLLETIFM